MVEVFTKILESGVLGAVLLLELWFIWQQHKDNRRLEEARAKDYALMVERLVAVNDKWQQVYMDLATLLNNNNASQELLCHVVEQMRELLSDMVRVSQLPPEPRSFIETEGGVPAYPGYFPDRNPPKRR